MAIRVEKDIGERSPYSARMTRRRPGSEVGELEELFEQLMEGGELEDVEGLEDFDWEELWDSFMGGEKEQQQGAYYPTMFGAPIRPTGFRREETPMFGLR